MTISQNLNELVKAITGANGAAVTISDGLKEFIRALDAGESITPADDTISELLEIVTAALPEKLSDGLEYVTDYTISEGVLTKGSTAPSGEIIADIPSGVTTIGAGAFLDNLFITKVIFPATVTTINDGEAWGSDRGAFNGCKSLNTVNLNSGLTTIGASAFGGCSSLESIAIPNSVTNIKESAFNSCAELSSVTFGTGLTTIGGYAFLQCYALTAVDLPDNVSSIAAAAFQNCTGLESASLPANLTTIASQTFKGCTTLESVYIKDNVTKIESSAFQGCSALTDVYFTGTEEQWGLINIVAENNDALTAATKHYEYTPE